MQHKDEDKTTTISKDVNEVLKNTKENILLQFNQSKSRISKRRVSTVEHIFDALKTINNDIKKVDESITKYNDNLIINDNKRSRLDAFEGLLVKANKEISDAEKFDLSSHLDQAKRELIEEV